MPFAFRVKRGSSQSFILVNWKLTNFSGWCLCIFFFFQYSNNITRDGAKQLALLLKANTPLEVLNLAYNRIEDDGAVALAEAVAAYNTNLTT